MKAIKQCIAVVAGLACLFASVISAPAQSKDKNGTARNRPTPATVEQPEMVKRYSQSITPDSLRPHLTYLASDELEGRETGTRGQKMAAEYLAKQYQSLGLMPKGSAKKTRGNSPDAYLQKFSLYPTTPAEARLEVTVSGKPVASSTYSADAHDDLAYLASGPAASGTGGVVFLGYGIGDDQLGLNDYAALKAQGIALDGKWLLMLNDEPLADAETSLLPTADRKPSVWTTGAFKKGLVIAKDSKPRGILLITDVSPRNKTAFNEAAATASRNARRIGGLRTLPTSTAPPVFNVSAKFANQLLASSGQTIETIKQQIDRTLKPNVFELKSTQLTAKIKARPPVQTENVLAMIEGSDPLLKKEVIVITAHYDHLGLNPALMGDQIFNGAADDASGTAASLELAKSMMAAKREGNGPRRSILFLNTSGEEKGILGSAYFLDGHTTVPMEQIVADINMDGVGGIDLKHPTGSKNYIYIGGAPDLSDDLISINKRVKESVGSTVELTDRDFPSDSVSFRSMLIPYLYFSTGLTEHYHLTTDEADTIDYDHLARVTQLIFATTWQIANQEARIAGPDRSQMAVTGFVCRPCGLECDNAVHKEPGTCPVCGMSLVPKWEARKQTSRNGR